MYKKIFILSFILLLIIPFSLFSQKDKEELLNSKTVSGMKFRSIGPAYASGRVTDIEVNPNNHSEYYVGVGAGNVWKTTNAGITFSPIFDKYGSYSIADVAIDPRNTNIVWVGTGEYNSQRAIGYGDGIYLSEDGGKSFKNTGLKKSEHIGRVVIDPRNSHVYVAAQGPLWGAGGDRGLYKTTDMGKTWNKILEISENTGITDIVFDKRNPDILYCASYQRRRRVFSIINGGEESAIYKSTDAGKNWRKLVAGLPAGKLGRIGLAISPVNPDYLFAIIEADNSKQGVYRSTDRGVSWKKVSTYMTVSPQYYNRLYCDPVNPEKIYSVDTYSRYSLDGGKTWIKFGLKHKHVDDHAFWIDPDDTNHIIIAGDGGIYDTYDNGKNWRHVPNLPVTQYYRVSIDNSYPFYNICGGTQDNNSMVGPSQTVSKYGILNSDWHTTVGGDGFFSAFDTKDPNIVYSEWQYGGLVRYDKKNKESFDIKPQEPEGEIYRWNWNAPLVISSHSHTRLYFAANKLFRTNDRGNSWEVISPDLTRQIDRNTLKIMGEIQSPEAIAKSQSTSLYGNIVCIAESPKNPDLLYVGTDDGLIQTTKDGGKTWTKYETFTSVPETTYVSCILTSQHDENTVYASFDGRKNSDLKPYILKSNDAGKTWKSIVSNLPERGTVYTIAEDFKDKNLIFVGTEFGVFFSNDAGKKWIQLKSGIPTTAVRDIKIQKRECDLVLATFGRAFYILDDYSPLRKTTEENLKNEVILFPVADALMYIRTGEKYGQGATYYAGKNPEFGATFTYYLKESLKTKKQIRKEKEKKLKEKGESIKYPSEEELRAEDDETAPYLVFEIKDAEGVTVRRIRQKASAGLHRANWGLMSFSTAPVLSGKSKGHENQTSGMPVLPGEYSTTLYKVQNGEKTKLAETQKFSTKTLYNSSLPKVDAKLLFAFRKDAAEAYRVSSAMKPYLSTVQKRLGTLETAFENSKNDNTEAIKKIAGYKKDLTILRRKLTGDETISKRNEAQTTSVSSRITSVLYGIWRSASAPTQIMKMNLEISKKALNEISEKTKVLIKNIEELEKLSKEQGNPFSIGIVPELKK